jgi:hypothetical protein
MELTADFKSITYPGAGGKCIFIINDNIVNCTIMYDSKSTYAPGSTKTVNLNIIKSDEYPRVAGQSDLSCDFYFAISLAFDKPVLTGYYASIGQIDCGIFKPNKPKKVWRDAFNL